MDKSFSISVNLLPKLEAEVLARQKKFRKIQLFGTTVVVILFFLVSITFALAFIQNFRLKKSEANLKHAKEQVEQFKSKEISLLVLKDRLKEIDRLQSKPSKQALLYKLLNNIVPASIRINVINIDRNSNGDLISTAQDVKAVDLFLNDLLDKQKNEDLIKSLSLDNFSRNRDGIYRIALKLNSEE